MSRRDFSGDSDATVANDFISTAGQQFVTILDSDVGFYSDPDKLRNLAASLTRNAAGRLDDDPHPNARGDGSQTSESSST